MKRRDLKPSPEKALRDLARRLADSGRSQTTVPPGVKDLGESGDVTWPGAGGGDGDGDRVSVRTLPVKLDEAREEIDAAQEAIDQAKADLDTERAAREAALEEAQETLAELDQRLEGVEGDSGALEEIRSDLAAAQAAVTAAQTTADEAVTAASAASQAALEAAGIAESKGRVLIQQAEPTGADRSSANIWIQPIDDDPETEVQERATTYVYLEDSDEWIPTTSDELAQAAQNALDAREAAQQAQQRADTAVANAATAQAAAEAAQRTADEATLDAREAHNEAVAAKDRADAAFQDLAGGPTVWEDSSFERSMGPLPGPYPDRIELSDEWSLNGSQSVKYTATGSGGNNYGAYYWVPVTPGHTYLLSWAVYAPEESAWTTQANTAETNGGASVRYPFRTADTTTWSRGEVERGSGIFTLDESEHWLRFWSGQPVAANGSDRAGDVIYLDEYRLVDITDTYPQYREALAAAEAAQDRADEAIAEAGKATTAASQAADNALTAAQAAADAYDAAEAAEASSAAATGAAGVAEAAADRAAADARDALAQVQAAGDDVAAAQAAVTAAQAAADEAERQAREAGTAAANADAAAARAAADAAQAALDALEAAREEIRGEIRESANGKNAITVSTSAPSASQPGVVAGDTWWRIDGDGVVFGQWTWTGSAWVAREVRSEVIANLDVSKLVVHDELEVVGDAVIGKLWADGIAARSALFSSLTVATGNLIPNGDLALGADYWDGAGSVVPIAGVDGYTRALTHNGNTIRPYTGPELRVVAGTEYVFECWLRADKPGSHLFIELRDQDNTLVATDAEILAGGDGQARPTSYMVTNYEVPTAWTYYALRFTAGEGASSASFSGFYFNHGNGAVTDAQVWIAGMSLRPRVGSVLIRDGSVGADQIIADEVAAEVSHLVEARIEKLKVTDGATINDAVIVKLASEMITAGVLRTATTGQRVVIDESGIVMYGLDPGGIEYELVRIGPSGDNLITAGHTTVSDAGVQAVSGDFDELTVGGDTLQEWLDPYPKGVVAFAHTASNSAWHGDGSEIRRLEVTAEIEPNRRYRVTLDQHYVQLRTANSASYLGHLKHGAPGSMQVFAATRWMLEGTTLAQTVSPLLGYLETSGQSSVEELTIGFTTRGPNGRDMRILTDGGDARLRLTVEDIGPVLASTGEALMSAGNAVEGSAGTRPVDPPKTVRRTKTYTSTGHATYNHDGSTHSGDVTQGLYGGGPLRNRRRGGWKFPSMTSDLSGATIEKVEAYIYMNHSWASAGATVNVATHNGNISNSLGRKVTVTGWKRNTGKWVRLPSSVHDGFRNGTYRGVGVIPTSSSTTQYAIFNRTGAKIRITYRK